MSVLNVRCAISTFKSNVAPLLNVLSEESRTALLNARILPLFQMPNVPQNVPLLYFLVRSYNKEKEAFRIGKNYLGLTVNEVALILGLPNAGREFQFDRLPQTNETHKSLVEEIHRLAEAEWSEELELRRINLLIYYLLVVFFFPLKTLRVPVALRKVKGLNDFQKYNWPKAIHAYLHSQLWELSTAYAIGETGTKLGYFEGCSVVLVIWLYEHCKLQTVVDDLARPRIFRWSPNKSYSSFFCASLHVLLKSGDKVNSHFMDIGEDEKILLAQVADDSDSDFEHPKKGDKRKPDRKTLRRLRKGSEKVNRSEPCVGVEEEEERVEERLEEERKGSYVNAYLDERLKSMETRLQSYIKEEIKNGVEAIKQCCEAAFSRARHQISPSSSLIPQTPLSPSKSPAEITLVDKTQASHGENITVSFGVGDENEVKPGDENSEKLSSMVKAVRKRHNMKRKNDVKLSYPGKDFVSLKVIDTINSVIANFSESDAVIFQSGNIRLTRRLVDDLLGTGWVEDTHLNAYAVVLSAKKKRFPKKFNNFLYLGPDYANCKKANFDACTRSLVSHFSERSVSASRYIIMPCHFQSHWALLVCDLTGKCWNYYDSLYTRRHFTGLQSLLDQLYEDVGKFMPDGYEKWPINEISGLPRQDNGYDCGVFVMKFMEAVLMEEEANAWDECNGWPAAMPKFRAEIAADIFRTFSRLINPK